MDDELLRLIESLRDEISSLREITVSLEEQVSSFRSAAFALLATHHDKAEAERVILSVRFRFETNASHQPIPDEAITRRLALFDDMLAVLRNPPESYLQVPPAFSSPGSNDNDNSDDDST